MKRIIAMMASCCLLAGMLVSCKKNQIGAPTPYEPDAESTGFVATTAPVETVESTEPTLEESEDDTETEEITTEVQETQAATETEVEEDETVPISENVADENIDDNSAWTPADNESERD